MYYQMTSKFLPISGLNMVLNHLGRKSFLSEYLPKHINCSNIEYKLTQFYKTRLKREPFVRYLAIHRHTLSSNNFYTFVF